MSSFGFVRGFISCVVKSSVVFAQSCLSLNLELACPPPLPHPHHRASSLGGNVAFFWADVQGRARVRKEFAVLLPRPDHLWTRGGLDCVFVCVVDEQVIPWLWGLYKKVEGCNLGLCFKVLLSVVRIIVSCFFIA